MPSNEISIALTTPGFEKVQTDFDRLTKKQKEIILSGSELGRQYERMRTKIDGVGSAAKKAGDQQKEGFGSKAIADLKSLAMGWIGVGAAIRGTTALAKAFHEEQRKGAEQVLNEEQAVRRYGQIAKTPQELDKLVNTGRKIAAAEGIDVTAAHDFTFGLASIGQLDKAESLSRLFRIASPQGATAISQGAVALSKAFGEQAGGVEAVVNQILAAAEASPVTAEQFAPAVLKAAPTAGMVGASAEETLAVLSQLSLLSGMSPEEAATQMSSFNKAMIERGMTGGFMETAAKIQAMNMSPQELQEFFGRVEGLKGFQNMLKLGGDIAQTRGSIVIAKGATGGAGDQLSARLAAVEDPTTARGQAMIAARDARVAEEERKQSDADTGGTLELQVKTAKDRAKTFNNANKLALSRVLGNMSMGIADSFVGAAFGATPESIESAGKNPFFGLGNAVDRIDRATGAFFRDPMGEFRAFDQRARDLVYGVEAPTRETIGREEAIRRLLLRESEARAIGDQELLREIVRQLELLNARENPKPAQHIPTE